MLSMLNLPKDESDREENSRAINIATMQIHVVESIDSLLYTTFIVWRGTRREANPSTTKFYLHLGNGFFFALFGLSEVINIETNM